MTPIERKIALRSQRRPKRSSSDADDELQAPANGMRPRTGPSATTMIASAARPATRPEERRPPATDKRTGKDDGEGLHDLDEGAEKCCAHPRS